MTERAIAASRRTIVACLAAILGGIIALAVAEAAAPMQLTYRVTHSTFGNIGTYINTIEPAAGGTTVQTRAHFEVKMLGVRMYREDAQRTERWQGNRLVWFQGVTVKGDNSTAIHGEAHGNNFVINTPHGTITAPATVRPANPWSANFLGSNTMMRPDDGRLERVQISAGQPAVIDLDGRPVVTRKYEIAGSTRYDVWLDGQGVPVKFVVEDDSGTVTFSLASCMQCGDFAAQRLGMR